MLSKHISNKHQPLHLRIIKSPLLNTMLLQHVSTFTGYLQCNMVHTTH